jgi:hypothetical protein
LLYRPILGLSRFLRFTFREPDLKANDTILKCFDVVGMTGKGACVAFRLMTSKQTAWRVKFASHFGDSKPDICCFDPRSTQSSKSASTRASFGGSVTSDCPVRHYDPRTQHFRRMNIDLPADS